MEDAPTVSAAQGREQLSGHGYRATGGVRRTSGLGSVLVGSGCGGLSEVREVLRGLVGAARAHEPIEEQPLGRTVYRLRFAESPVRSVVVKCLRPPTAYRTELLMRSWLPAQELDGTAPALLGVAAAQAGEDVWHVYEDVGQRTLALSGHDQTAVAAAVRVIADVHTSFVGAPVLPECRLWGRDLGPGFYESTLRDALAVVNSARAAGCRPSDTAGGATLDRLAGQLQGLLASQPPGSSALLDTAGPETLLHGDLWPINVVAPDRDGHVSRPKLVDWDGAGVGSVTYDLSAFLYRLPSHVRPWALERYREAVGGHGWRLPGDSELNVLCTFAEQVRLANMAIWVGMSAAETGARWAFEQLARIDGWLGRLRAPLPTVGAGGAVEVAPARRTRTSAGGTGRPSSHKRRSSG